MLFDLRSRGRRRTVQAIYLGLALLMGVGLVGFGVGGGLGSTGIFDAISGNKGGGGGNGLDGQVKAAEKRVAVAPRNPRAWAALAHARYQLAGVGDNYDQANGTFTPKGRIQLGQVKQAWDRYLGLNPPHPDANVATEMVTALGPQGLNQPAAAVGAQEIVVGAQAPSAGQFARLAALAYLAGQTRTGDLAAARAVALAPKDQRSQLKQQLDQAKGQAASAGGAAGSPAGAGGAGAGSGAPASSGAGR